MTNAEKATLNKLKEQRDEARAQVEALSKGSVPKADYDAAVKAKEDALSDLASEVRAFKKSIKDMEATHAADIERLTSTSEVPTLTAKLATMRRVHEEQLTEIAGLKDELVTALKERAEYRVRFEAIAEDGDIKKLRRRLQEAKAAADEAVRRMKDAEARVADFNRLRAHNKHLINENDQLVGLLKEAREKLNPTPEAPPTEVPPSEAAAG